MQPIDIQFGRGFGGCLCGAFCLALLCFSSARAADTSDRTAAVAFDSMFKTYCLQCHNAQKKKGKVNFEAALGELPLVRNGKLWLRALDQIKSGDMPPDEAKTKLDDTARKKLMDLIDKAINHFDYDKIKDPGHEPIRRLTHKQYNHTVSDLFGIELRPADGFPPEQSGSSGFDNSANTLFFPSTLLERYINAADHIVESALVANPTTEMHRRVRRRVYGDVAISEKSGVADAKAILSRFLVLAYRRPARPEDLAESLALFVDARKAGKAFEPAIKQAIKNVLISPSFLMRVELGADSAKPAAPYRVDDWALGSRLSYFLWASMPDDTLFDLARQGKLHDPAALRAQVDRMLADDRSITLGSIMASQWLGFQHLGSRRRPDPLEHKAFTDTLMVAMREESALTFSFVIRKNRRIHELIDADYTYVNEELARYYRWKNIKGDQMRRVRLVNKKRGGMLTQASLLMVTAYPDRTSPVLRGNWLLSQVLGTPPPPPPDNAGEFDESIAERDMTERRRLELHRRNPKCMSCHERIDPLGFALENYNELGAWRTRNEGRRIDAKGKLPEGVEIDGPGALKEALIEHRLDDFATQMTRKMLSYALGRQLEYYDEAAVRKIVKALKADGYRTRTLMYGIVESFPFQYTRRQTVAASQRQGVEP